MGDLYTDYETAYDNAADIAQQTDHEEVAFFANLVDRGQRRVADIGCAEGRLVVECARRGHSVTGVDISESFLRQTEALAHTHGVTIETVKADLEQGIDEFKGEVFDTIFLNDVIEHFRNPVAALHNLRKVLVDDGRLIIHTPNCASPGRLKMYVFHPRARLNFYDPAVLGDFHFQTYDQVTLEKTLNFVGLEVERMVPTRFTTLGVHAFARMFKPLPRLIAKTFPHLADTLLFICKKGEPIDVEKQLKYWREHPVQ